jgi:O-antigen/teichoic acid export membrane protein
MSRLGTGLDSPSRVSRSGLAHGFWVAGDQAVVSLANFLSTVIVGRVCGQEEMGIYGLAVSIFWLAAAIPNALVWTPYTSRAAGLTPRRRAIFAGSVTSHALAVAAVFSVVLLSLSLLPLAGAIDSDWFAAMCIALVPFTIMMMLREHIRRINLADLASRELLAIDLPIALLQMGLLLLLAKLGKLSAATALVAVAIASCVAIVWLVLNRDRFTFRRRHAAIHWSHNQQFGRWLLFVSLAWLLGDSSYRWLVGSIHGLAALGQFSAAQSMVLALNPLLLTVNNLAQALSASALARGGIVELRRAAVRGTLLLFVVAGVGFACLAVIGGTLVELVFGSQFTGLGGAVAAISLGMFANCLQFPVDAAMVALRRGRAMTITALVKLALAIGAGAPLIAWFGLEGVGYAMAVSCLTGAALQWCFFLQEHGDE